MEDNKKWIIRFVIFLIINFAALAIGGLSTTSGVISDWYAGLNKAPWTPPGWVFGASWTLIMLCLSLYMAYLWPKVEDHKMLIGLFGVQWILNVIWNPLFFNYKMVIIGLIVISSLTILVAFIMNRYKTEMKSKSWLLAPYVIWLVIATSLNAYVVLNN